MFWQMIKCPDYTGCPDFRGEVFWEMIKCPDYTGCPDLISFRSCLTINLVRCLQLYSGTS